MFDEYKCGCIVSPFQGRVRICLAHRPERATGDGAVSSTAILRGIVRQYPANGETVTGWNGR